MIRVDKSIAQWRDGVAGLTVIALPGRAAQWHLPWLAWPKTTMQAVNAI